MKRALITGITGQDGVYLTEYLLQKNYSVTGISSNVNSPKAIEFRTKFPLVQIFEIDLNSIPAILEFLKNTHPDEIYNLAAKSSAAESWQNVVENSKINAFAVLCLLEAVRLYSLDSKNTTRFLQASSSEIFGKAETAMQNENSSMRPQTPYGVAKLFAHNMVQTYRSGYEIFAVNAILFNHESPLRNEHFVTRKITSGVARIASGDLRPISLGNLETRRDWGHALDYVKALNLMLQSSKPMDFVIGTGKTHSIREILNIAFGVVGISDWTRYVIHDPGLERPASVDPLIADTKSAYLNLKWEPAIDFRALIEEMVDRDMRKYAKK